MPTTIKGTAGYMAPELLGLTKPGEPYTIDIWAAGEITFRLLTKTPVFPHAGALVEYLGDINNFPLWPSIAARVGPASATFILSLMRPIPHDRVSAAGALDDRWITQTLPIPTQPASRAYSSPYTSATVEDMTEDFASWNTVTSAKTSTTIIQGKPETSTKISHSRFAHLRSNNVGVPVPPPPSIPRIKLLPQIALSSTPPTYPMIEPPKLTGHKPRDNDDVLLAAGVKAPRPERSSRFSLSDTDQKRSTPPPRRIPSSRSYQDISSVKKPSGKAQPPPLPPRKSKVDSTVAPRKYHGISHDIAVFMKSPPKLPGNTSQETQSPSIDPLSLKVLGLGQSKVARDLASFATPPKFTVDTPQKNPSSLIARDIAEFKMSSAAKEPHSVKRTTGSLATPLKTSEDISKGAASLLSRDIEEFGRLKVADYLDNDSISTAIARFRTQRLSDSHPKETSATRQGSSISEIPRKNFDQPSLSTTIATSGTPPAPPGSGSEPDDTARMVFPGSGDEFWAGRTVEELAEAILDASAAYPDDTDQAMKRLEENSRNKPH
jgi:serine/threonine protein kinase